MSTGKSIVIVSVVIALAVGLAGGYFWGYAKGYTNGGAAVVASYALKVAQVKALFPVPPDVRSLSGQVEAVSDTMLTLKAASITQNPFADTFPAIREVAIASSTKITSVSQKDPAELQREMQVFAEKMAGVAASSAPRAAVAPPSPFTETDISLSDIKAGDTVTVTADSNILNSANFTATAIQKQILK